MAAWTVAKSLVTCEDHNADRRGMRLLTRLLRRSLILGLGVVSVWLIVFVAFDFADQRLPWLLALSV